MYLFDGNGRHFQTLDAYTGAILYAFAYDAAGHLVTIRDGAGQTTTVERNAYGDPIAIAAPGGQQTELSEAWS